jgi:hypothetical protein
MRASGIIRVIKANWQIVWLLVVVALMPVLFNPSLHRWWHFKQLESEFQSKMDPEQIRRLAADILTEHVWDKNIHYYYRGTDTANRYSYPGWLGTDFPPETSQIVRSSLTNLGCPNIEIHPDCVVMFGGWHGQPQLVVGATNFVCSDDRAKMWMPGIYIKIPDLSARN